MQELSFRAVIGKIVSREAFHIAVVRAIEGASGVTVVQPGRDHQQFAQVFHQKAEIRLALSMKPDHLLTVY